MTTRRRTVGTGDVGNFLDITCYPDSTFATEITALIAAGTEVEGKLVSLTWSANYQVTSPADGAIPDGKIISVEKDATNTYILGVRLFSYIDQNSVRHTPVAIINLAYSGTIALQDSIIVNGTTYKDVDDGTTGGWGAVISIDTTGASVDVLF